MIRQTSIDCYNQILHDGTLTKRKLQVYTILKDMAPCTGGELEREFNIKHNLRGSWKQLSILKEWGVIHDNLPTRKCNVSGQVVLVWDLTDMLPTKPTKVIDGKPKGFQKVMWYVIDMMEKSNTQSFTLKALKEKYGKIKK